MIKKTVSTKVPESKKEKLEEEAKSKGISLSELVAEKLNIDLESKEKAYRSEIDELEKKLKEKDDLISKMSDNLSTEQKLLSQQQELQLMAQKQIVELQRNNQLLIESESESKKWWQIWK